MRDAGPIILGGQPLRLHADPYEGLPEDEQRRLNKYLRVRRHGDTWTVSKRDRYAGLVRAGDTTYWLQPPFSPAAFVYLLLRHRNAPEAADRAYLAASNLRDDRSLRDLMRALAATMVTEAARLASGHIAQSYVARTERLGVVRGRPQWHRQAGRPADGTVICRFDEKTTDILENRLVLAGLDAALRWADTPSARSAARQQQFVWRSIAEPHRPEQFDFDIADLRLNRLTDGYRPALSVARALIFGFDLNADPNTDIYAPVFDLASLFETLMQLVTESAVQASGFEVTAQTSERRAILNGIGETYRRIRPDLLVTRGGRPALVIDSKFKPKYATGGPIPRAGNKVTREDIFQTFFYANRLANRHGLGDPIPAVIAAPRLSTSGEGPNSVHRSLRWGEDASGEEARLTLVLVPVEESVAAIRDRNVPFCKSLFAETRVL